MRSVVGVSLLAACGRLGFEETPLVDARATDDAAAVTPFCDRVPAALYCTDFEAGDLGAANANGGGFIADGWEGAAYSFTVEPSNGQRIAVGLDPVRTSGALHITARARIDAAAAVTSYVVIAQGLSATFDEKVSFDLVSEDRAQLVSTIAPGASSLDAPGTIPRGRWFCFQFVLVIADAGRAAVDFEGTTIELLPFDARPDDGFAVAEIGAFTGANPDPVTVAFDNFVVATSPVGCL